MRKTTVYLSDEQAEALRRTSSVTGKSQSDLIREGIAAVTKPANERVFRSRGAGDSGDPTLAERFDEVLAQDLWDEYREMIREFKR
jgi:hypothetical protein